MKVESKNEYTVAVTNDTSKRGKSGDNIGKILPYAESFDSLLHMHTMGFYSEALEDFAGDWNVMKGSLNLPEIQKGITVVKQPLAYKCEIIVEAGVQIMTVKAENLSRLPEEPSNVTLSSSSCQEESIAAPKIPWRVGALARCIGRSGRFSGLGRESKMCCISAVNLEQNKVSVCVTTQEGTLSELGVATIGDLVCLANRHHDVIDGPLVPGQRATILAIDNNLVLVQVLPDKSKKEAREGGFSFTAPQPGAFGFAAPPQPGALSFTRTQSNGFDEKTNWWYHAQVLAPYEFSSALPAQASSSHTISCTPVAKSGCANRGVFFDVVNIGKQSMTIVQLVAAANDDNIATKLFVCKKGACKGNETNVSSWRQVWSGTLKDHKPTTIVIQEIITIESGKKQGFLLHTEKNKVLYSKQVVRHCFLLLFLSLHFALCFSIILVDVSRTCCCC